MGFITFFLSILILLIVGILLPRWVGQRYPSAARYAWMPVVAAFAYFISWYLPSLLIHEVNTAFTTHLIGGGVFSGLLWLYWYKVYGWRMKSVLGEIMTLLGFVSVLGVANELLELGAVELGVIRLALADTSWDLLANTLGALLVYVVYRSVAFVGRYK